MIVALLLAGQVVIGDHVIPPNEYDAGVALIRQALDDELLDYPSARFRDVSVTAVVHDDGDHAVYFCGEVNARNLSGAYTGWAAAGGGVRWAPEDPFPLRASVSVAENVARAATRSEADQRLDILTGSLACAVAAANAGEETYQTNLIAP